jgi:hypothetical protein
MDRRTFIGSVAGTLLAAPLAAARVEAQRPSHTARVGALFPSIDNALFRAYFEGLRGGG